MSSQSRMTQSQINQRRLHYSSFRRKGLLLTRDWRIYYNKLAAYQRRTKMGLRAVPPQTPSPTPKPPPIVEDPNFSGMDPPSRPAVHREFERRSWSPTETVRIRKFMNNREVLSFPNVYAAVDFSVSYIAVGTYVK